MTVPTFPTLAGLIYPVTKTPTWSTTKQDSISGRRTRFQLWSSPQYKIEVGYSRLRSDSPLLEWQQFLGFFNSVGGDAQIFQFTDPDDGSISAQLIGIGDGTTTAFQLVRSMNGFVEPVFCPTAVQIFFNGTLQSAGNYTVSNTGLVTFLSAPGASVNVTWTGTYNWYSRFDDSTCDLVKFANSFWELKKISFTTEKF